LANHASVLDFFYLYNKYCPLIAKVVFYKDKSGKRAGVRELTMFEVFTHSFMIKFPQSEENVTDFSGAEGAMQGGFYKDLKALRDSKYVKNRPIVLIPECTNTNGKGLLKFPDSVVDDLILPAIEKQGF
jgi:hypothetical protein